MFKPIAQQWCLLYIFGVTHFRFHIHSSPHWLHLTFEITWISFLLHKHFFPHRGSHGVGVRMTRGFSGDMTKSWNLWCNNWHVLTIIQVTFFCCSCVRIMNSMPRATSLAAGFYTTSDEHVTWQPYVHVCLWLSIEDWICQGPLLLLKVQFYNGICSYVTKAGMWMNEQR